MCSQVVYWFFDGFAPLFLNFSSSFRLFCLLFSNSLVSFERFAPCFQAPFGAGTSETKLLLRGSWRKVRWKLIVDGRRKLRSSISSSSFLNAASARTSGQKDSCRDASGLPASSGSAAGMCQETLEVRDVPRRQRRIQHQLGGQHPSPRACNGRSKRPALTIKFVISPRLDANRHQKGNLWHLGKRRP